METNSPGYYDKHVGKTFNEAVQKLYELEEEKTFHSVGEDYKKQLYKHSFSLKEGYTVEELDMDTVFFEQVELLKPYKKDAREYCVYTTSSAEEMQQAKEILKDLFENNYKHTFKRQLEKAKESYEKFESMVDSMMSNDDVFSKKDEKEEDDDYGR
jgi:glutamate synthase domain-containing protein 2